MNVGTVIGELWKCEEKTSTKGTQWCQATLSLSEKVDDKWVSTYVKVVAFGPQVKALMGYKQGKGGDKIYVTGPQKFEAYTDKTGAAKVSQSIIAQMVSKVGSGYNPNKTETKAEGDAEVDDEPPFMS